MTHSRIWALPEEDHQPVPSELTVQQYHDQMRDYINHLLEEGHVMSIMSAEATEELPDPKTINVADLDALKHADAVVFRNYGGISTIEASLHSRNPAQNFSNGQKHAFPNSNAYGEISRTIIVEGWTSNSWDDLDTESSGVTAFIAAQHDPNWRTVLGLLKPRDRLTLRFMANRYNNAALNGAGLHADALVLLVERGRNGSQQFTLDVRIGPSGAGRMIREQN